MEPRLNKSINSQRDSGTFNRKIKLANEYLESVPKLYSALVLESEHLRKTRTKKDLRKNALTVLEVSARPFFCGHVGH